MERLWKKYRGVFFYGGIGVLTTLINIGTYHLCYEIWSIPNVPSNTIAWVLAVTFAYVTNKLWVFGSKRFSPSVLLSEIWKFASCRLVTGIMDIVIMFIGVDIFHGPATLLKLGSNVLVIVLNYVFGKFIIFKEN